jgi:hypothetical protein
VAHAWSNGEALAYYIDDSDGSCEQTDINGICNNDGTANTVVIASYYGNNGTLGDSYSCDNRHVYVSAANEWYATNNGGIGSDYQVCVGYTALFGPLSIVTCPGTWADTMQDTANYTGSDGSTWRCLADSTHWGGWISQWSYVLGGKGAHAPANPSALKTDMHNQCDATHVGGGTSYTFPDGTYTTGAEMTF